MEQVFFADSLFIHDTTLSWYESFFITGGRGGWGGGWGRGLDFGCLTLKFTFSSFKAP